MRSKYIAGEDVSMHYLIEPNLNLAESYKQYMQIWLAGKEPIVPIASFSETDNFSETLSLWNRAKIDPLSKFVPATLYFLINTSSEIVGAVHIRHYLNQSLLQNGGHIGYGIRPDKRNLGLGTLCLKLGLDLAQNNHNLRAVLLTCDKHNLASARVIEKNQGAFAGETTINNEVVKRYWVVFNDER